MSLRQKEAEGYALIRDHQRGKNARHEAMGEFANSLILRSMSAVEKVDMVVVDSLSLSDKVSLYPCKGLPLGLGEAASWAEDIVPRLNRQHTNELRRSEPMLRVITHNGGDAQTGHFQSTQACMAVRITPSSQAPAWVTEPVAP